MAVVGPGAVVQSDISPTPQLQGIGSDKIVTVFNPLSDDFAIQVGVSQAVPVPITVKDPATKGNTTLSESDITRTYGVGLKNPEFTSRKHFTNQAVIKSGQSMRFTGDVAQVAVRQLVNELMQREGNTKFMADPVKRQAAEERVILSIQSQEDFMNKGITTVDQQVQEALSKANEANDEQAFPGFNEGGAVQDTAPAERDEAAPRKPGRPKTVGA